MADLLLDFCQYLQPGRVFVGGRADDFVFSGQALQLAQRRIFPGAGAYFHRDDFCLPAFVAGHGPGQFGFDNVIGSQKIGAQQQENDVGGSQRLFDFGIPFFSRANLPVVPQLNFLLLSSGRRCFRNSVR